MDARKLILCLAALLAACSSPPPPPQQVVYPPSPADSPDKVVWYELPGGLALNIEAAPDANFVDGQPHAIDICVMQARSREAVANMAATPQGLAELLQCAPRTPEIITAEGRSMQPGEKQFIPGDRREGARFLAVAAGYDGLDPKSCFAVVPFPVTQAGHTSGIIFTSTSYTYAAAPMNARITLGKTALAVKGETRVD